jgi:hypothetical protein
MQVETCCNKFEILLIKILVVIMFCTRETPGSNIGWDPGNTDRGLSLFYSISS